MVFFLDFSVIALNSWYLPIDKDVIAFIISRKDVLQGFPRARAAIRWGTHNRQVGACGINFKSKRRFRRWLL